MGKFSYKKKKGTKKQSFKNRKKIGKVGGGDDGDGESKTENANVTTNSTEPSTEPTNEPSTEPTTEPSTEPSTANATIDAVTTNTPDSDSGYKEFLESLKTDPNLLRKTVYLWTSLEKMFIWNDETKKWEDKRNELIEEETGEEKVEENKE